MTRGGTKASLGRTNSGRGNVAASPSLSRQILRLMPPFMLITTAANLRRLQAITSNSSYGPSSAVAVPPQPFLEIDKVCPPASSKINSANDWSPPSKVMHLGQVREAAKGWYEINCPATESCTFASVGQHLLQIANRHNSTLLTVQVDATDGKSNDPMYNMFVRDQSFKNHLTNWLPVLIEPVPANFEALVETYAEIPSGKGLACAVPIHAAVLYGNIDAASCQFCRVNTADDAPPQCKELPDWMRLQTGKELPEWMRLQIGTLNCDGFKRYIGRDKFDTCIVQDPLPCSTMSSLLLERNVPRETIAMLQIDVEGYEYILLEGFFEEMPDHLLPPIIHLEQKVMIYEDGKYPLAGNSTRMGITKNLLRDRGYVLHGRFMDLLAIRLY